MLDGVDGGGRLADQNTETILTILQNDDPIFFSDIFYDQEEGQSVTLTVLRGGQRQGAVFINLLVFITSLFLVFLTYTLQPHSLIHTCFL